MLRITAVAFTLLALPAAVAFAEEEVEGHENWFQIVDPVDLGEVKVVLEDVLAQDQHIQIKARFENQTSDWIFVKKEAAVVKAAGKSLQQYDGKEKPALVIKPDAKAGHT